MERLWESPCPVLLIGIDVTAIPVHVARGFTMSLPFDQMASFLEICPRGKSNVDKKKLYEQRCSCYTIYNTEKSEAF